MFKIVHAIRQLTEGGGTKGLLSHCRATVEFAKHSVISVLPPASDAVVEAFARSRIDIISPDECDRAIAESDVMQIEWWNSAALNNFLVNRDFPPHRALFLSRVHPDAPLMCPSRALLERADEFASTTQSALANPALKQTLDQLEMPSQRVIFSAAELVSPSPRPQLNRPITFGYLGTVELIKLHPRFLDLISLVHAQIPEAQFLFAGDGPLSQFQAEVTSRGLGNVVKFLGPTEQPHDFLKQVDIFFYPLNRFTYGTSEKALQEAMMHSLPCVVFPYGGVKDLVTPANGLVAQDESAFVDACIRAATNEAVRRRLGDAARVTLEALHRDAGYVRAAKDAYCSLRECKAQGTRDQRIPHSQLLEFSSDTRNIDRSALSELDRADLRFVESFVTTDYSAWAASLGRACPPKPQIRSGVESRSATAGQSEHRIERIDFPEFCRIGRSRIESIGRPIIVQVPVPEPSALEDSLLASLGDVPVMMFQRPAAMDAATKSIQRAMRLAEFLGDPAYRNPPDGGTCRMVSNLKGHSEQVERLVGQTLTDAMSFERFGCSANLWVSFRGQFTRPHFDELENFNLQLAGAKTFHLYPPGVRNYYVRPLLTGFGHHSELVDFEMADTERYPRIVEARKKRIVAELVPGDMLYLPLGWWHQVRSNAGLNVNLNFWLLSPKILRHPYVLIDALYKIPFRRLTGRYDYSPARKTTQKSDGAQQ